MPFRTAGLQTRAGTPAPVLRVLAIALLALAAAAQAPPTPLGAAAWREDLKVFRSKFGASGIRIAGGIATKGQKDLDKLYPSFQSDVAALEEAAGGLSDQEMALRLMRLVASGGVAHTTVNMPLNLGFYRRLPIRLVWFADGLAITEAAADYSSAIGARVIRIGSMTPEEALKEITPYVSQENDVGLRVSAPEYLVRLAVLSHLKLIGPDGRVSFTLQRDSAGTLQKDSVEPFVVQIPLDDPRTPRIGLSEVLHVPTPLYLSNRSLYYWFRYLPDSQTFYIQYNQCANDPKLPFVNFVRTAMAELDSKAADHKIQRVVIDLRLNGGGNSRVIAPLKSALQARAKTIGKPYVLMGGFTFSSALMAASDLREEAHAILVGSPPGENLNSYGEIDTFELPNSKLKVTFSTKYFQLGKAGAPPGLNPDISAPPTLADAIAGRDAALEAAITARAVHP
jgi:hypothetical protein